MPSVKYFLLLVLFVFSILPRNSYAPSGCATYGGTCNACGTYYYCSGGTADGHVYTSATCFDFFPLSDGCYDSTSDLTCICPGCSVDVSGGVASCMSAGCGGACVLAPELSEKWHGVLLMVLAGVVSLGFVFLRRKLRS